MSEWTARLIVATALIFSSGIAIISLLLGSLAVLFTLGLVRAIAQPLAMRTVHSITAARPPQTSATPMPKRMAEYNSWPRGTFMAAK